ncbi:MAG: hypothetical protein AAGH15_24390 [Myxococcota bacterium]
MDTTLSLCPVGHFLMLVAATYVLVCASWATRELVRREETGR